MIKTILVAGIRSADNQVIDLCETLGLEVTHLPDLGTRTIPLRDAVVIAATAISTGMDRQVKEVYKSHDREIFYSNNGVSNFKTSFLKSVLGAGVCDVLNSFQVPSTTKVLYFAARFFHPGDKIKCKDFKSRIRRILDKDMGSSVDNFLNNAIARSLGLVERVEEGLYIWKGITRRAYEELTENGLQLDEDPVFIESGPQTPYVKRKAAFRPVAEQTIDIEVVSEKETTPMIPESIMPAHKKEDSEAAYIILEALEKYEAKQAEAFEAMERFEKRLNAIEQTQMVRLNGYEERIAKAMDQLEGTADFLLHSIKEQFKHFSDLDRKALQSIDESGRKIVAQVNEAIALNRDMGELAEEFKGTDKAEMIRKIQVWKMLNQNFVPRQEPTQLSS